MRRITEVLEMDFSCLENTVIDGVISGSVTVHEPAELVLNGVISGSLNVNKNTYVRLNGIVNGDVTNVEGKLDIYGIINGRLLTDNGETFVHKEAIVKNR